MRVYDLKPATISKLEVVGSTFGFKFEANDDHSKLKWIKNYQNIANNKYWAKVVVSYNRKFSLVDVKIVLNSMSINNSDRINNISSLAFIYNVIDAGYEADIFYVKSIVGEWCSKLTKEFVDCFARKAVRINLKEDI